ncbi:PREDICTED: ribosomal L1 domain-containing protein CG13096-like [Papilio xuthus]|uniref:Ribosomal L1 domain-containing protein CG13096-like n=1 Tax=Papilio xuthus TaxID=66420 RepID=A0AAJ6ZCI1_PAPXU|nr:PREDICTED: ribosomal L1 domain-containing protein CG13096-like [Papilio xuthus]
MVSVKPNLEKRKEKSIKLKPNKKISNVNAKKKITNILKNVNVEKLQKDSKEIIKAKKNNKISEDVSVNKLRKVKVNAKKITKVKENGSLGKLHKNAEEKINVKEDKKILDNIGDHKVPKDTEEVVKAKKVKYVMPSKAVKEDLVNSCLNALQKLTIHHNKKNTIFGTETSIFAEIRCIKIPRSRGNVKFVLPHSTAASTREICLITPDLKKGKRIDHEPTIDHWKDILQEAGVTEVKTVLPLRQLKVEYDQFELKRRLLTQHDFIMVDTRVLNHASHLLGKMFFKKHNMLIPVKVNEKGNIKKDVTVGLRTTMLRLNEGHTSTILVGHTSMAQNDLKENILSLISQLKDRYPGGEANIRAISLKLPLSLSLPLYLTLRSINTVGIPKLAHKKPKHFTTVEDELSTIPGSTVRVEPDGTVHVKKPKKGDRINKEENNIEDEDRMEDENESEEGNSEAEISEED